MYDVLSVLIARIKIFVVYHDDLDYFLVSIIKHVYSHFLYNLLYTLCIQNIYIIHINLHNSLDKSDTLKI